MIVYRYCSRKEADMILERRYFDDIGCQRVPDKLLNTHKYKKNVNYMHFYLDKKSYYYACLFTNHCICTYDIPDELVKEYSGFGYYHNREGKLESVKECAIPSQFIYFDYLESIAVLNGDHFYDDYVNDKFPCFLDTIYKKQEKVKKIGFGSFNK